jgi:anti-sigma regulatory factor (Ser/Thr protein kinase)
MTRDLPAAQTEAPATHAAALTFSVRKSSPPPVELARRTIRSFLQNPPRTEHDHHCIELIVEEWLTNLVRYGCAEGRTHLASLTLTNLGLTVRIRLEDDCAAFDPLALPPPPVDADLDQRQFGGLGVHLIRSMVEEFSYERRRDKNIWELIRRIDTPAHVAIQSEDEYCVLQEEKRLSDRAGAVGTVGSRDLRGV